MKTLKSSWEIINWITQIMYNREFMQLNQEEEDYYTSFSDYLFNEYKGQTLNTSQIRDIYNNFKTQVF